MRYIERLQTENKALKEVVDQAQHEIDEITKYLLSSKFNCGNELDQYVNVKDVLSRLDNLRNQLWR